MVFDPDIGWDKPCQERDPATYYSDAGLQRGLPMMHVETILEKVAVLATIPTSITVVPSA